MYIHILHSSWPINIASERALFASLATKPSDIGDNNELGPETPEGRIWGSHHSWTKSSSNSGNSHHQPCEVVALVTEQTNRFCGGREGKRCRTPCPCRWWLVPAHSPLASSQSNCFPRYRNSWVEDYLGFQACTAFITCIYISDPTCCDNTKRKKKSRWVKDWVGLH